MQDFELPFLAAISLGRKGRTLTTTLTLETTACFEGVQSLTLWVSIKTNTLLGKFRRENVREREGAWTRSG